MARATYQPWPELPYEEFAPTAYLIHMITQVVGKLKLATPFEPQWANVPLWVTSRGLTTGPIPNGAGAFTVDIDLIGHVLTVATTWGGTGSFALKPSSVADAFERIMATLKETGVEAIIDTMPQEIANPAQIECGWWHGGPNHPKPAYYSFTFPQPAEIAQSTLKVSAWDSTMGEFILDYDHVRTAHDPEAELYAFLESAYDAGAKLAGWDPALLGSGKPSEAGQP